MPEVTAATAAGQLPLPPGVRRVHGEVYFGPDSAVVGMASRVRGIVSALEEPSTGDAVAQRANPAVKFLHLPLLDTADQPLRSAIATTVDFVTALVADDGASDEDSDEPPPLQPDNADENDDGGAVSAAAAAPTGGEADATDCLPPPPPRRGVFIHCHAGQSRSAALALGYLMAARDLSLQAAVDSFGGPENVAVNPGFLGQLIALDEELAQSSADGGRAAFDTQTYYVANLLKLFPRASEHDVREALAAAKGDIYAARNALMRAHAAAFVDRDKIMVDCLCAAVRDQYIPRRIVAETYEQEGKHRDRALARLLALTPEALVDMMTEADMMSM